MPVCSNCGKEVPQGVAFCTACGTPVAQPASAAPDPTPTIVRETAPASPAVSTGSFFGMMFLFSIPVIGWLICLIMAFSSKNENRRHFAKATLIWLLIAVVMTVVIGLLAYFASPWLSQYLSQISGGQFSNLKDLIDQLKSLTDGLSLPAE